MKLEVPNRYLILGVATSAGIVLGILPIFDPIHEFYHVMVAADKGVGGRITGWSLSQLDSFNFPAIFAGYSADLWLGCVLAVLGGLIGLSKPWLTGGAGWGYAFSRWGGAFWSHDFTELPKQFIDMQPDLSFAQKAAVWDVVHREISRRWMMLGLVLLAISALAILAMAYRRPVKSAPPARGSVS